MNRIHTIELELGQHDIWIIRVVIRNFNFHNLYVIGSLYDERKVEIALSVCCLNVQSLKNQVKPVADCAFTVAAPTLWNRLPADIINASSLENFKSVLKHTCSRLHSQLNINYLLNLF